MALLDQRYPALRRFADEGVISKISVQFPSTTAAHVTTINAMQSVGESGVYEWFYYEPILDAIIAPLTFSYAGTPRETLRSVIAPQAILPHQTIYQELAAHGVQSYAFQDIAYAHSSYSKTLFNGAQIVPFYTLSQGLTNLRLLLEASEMPTYCFFYYSSIDSIAHGYGPDSAHHRAEIDMFFTALERLFFAELPRDGETLILLTADHGQVEVDPSTTHYLNRELPQLTPLLRTDQRGAPLVPAGSARDMFLYVKAAHVQEAYEMLAAHLRGAAEVYRTADLLAEGFFGARCSDLFRARLGELVILPYAHQSVWWYEQGRFEQNFFGHHGGLTPDEMHSAFMVLLY
ncbi:MAG: alkaline phosphatase family protein [Chloroflexi bacterium]|nr:alkaline phosphatase family protein [Chloroflexota bacterium]